MAEAAPAPVADRRPQRSCGAGASDVPPGRERVEVSGSCGRRRRLGRLCSCEGAAPGGAGGNKVGAAGTGTNFVGGGGGRYATEGEAPVVAAAPAAAAAGKVAKATAAMAAAVAVATRPVAAAGAAVAAATTAAAAEAAAVVVAEAAAAVRRTLKRARRMSRWSEAVAPAETARSSSPGSAFLADGRLTCERRVRRERPCVRGCALTASEGLAAVQRRAGGATSDAVHWSTTGRVLINGQAAPPPHSGLNSRRWPRTGSLSASRAHAHCPCAHALGHASEEA